VVVVFARILLSLLLPGSFGVSTKICHKLALPITFLLSLVGVVAEYMLAKSVCHQQLLLLVVKLHLPMSLSLPLFLPLTLLLSLVGVVAEYMLAKSVCHQQLLLLVVKLHLPMSLSLPLLLPLPLPLPIPSGLRGLRRSLRRSFRLTLWMIWMKRKRNKRNVTFKKFLDYSNIIALTISDSFSSPRTPFSWCCPFLKGQVSLQSRSAAFTS
jgi:hypothetical protein